MIHTSKQLKDKVRNVSEGDTRKAQALIRNFIMERFLERVSVSEYRERFILKGGMLVASIVGVEMRSTMDIDTTVKALPLNIIDTKKIIEEILSVELEDGVTFQITKVSDIMPDFEYPGVRLMIEARLDRLRQTFKLDISTDDVITPSAINYEYPLMFEDRVIELLSYNTETLIAEKLQTVLSRGIANTRLRDYYDIYMIEGDTDIRLDYEILKEAFHATCLKRGTIFSVDAMNLELSRIIGDQQMKVRWEHFKRENYFVGDIVWEDVLMALEHIVRKVKNDNLTRTVI